MLSTLAGWASALFSLTRDAAVYWAIISPLLRPAPWGGSAIRKGGSPRFSFGSVSVKIRRSAMLVRGVDEYGYWDPEPKPRQDMDPVAVEIMRKSWQQYLTLAKNQGAK